MPFDVTLPQNIEVDGDGDGLFDWVIGEQFRMQWSGTNNTAGAVTITNMIYRFDGDVLFELDLEQYGGIPVAVGGSWGHALQYQVDATDALAFSNQVLADFELRVEVEYRDAGGVYHTVYSDDPAVAGLQDPTFIPVDTLELGGTIFDDDDENGQFAAPELGIAGVVVNLYADDGDGVFDAGDTFLGTTITDADGDYTFASLGQGDYIAEIDASNYSSGGALEGLGGSTIGATDPDDNEDNDSNGIDIAGGGIASAPIRLDFNSEPTPGAGNDVNTTLDFGLLNFNDVIPGTPDRDLLFGGLGDDSIDGLAGNDVVSGGAGADTLAGGLGIDFLDYSDSDAGVSVDLSTDSASGGHATGDVISGFERIIGSAHADGLTGDGGNNLIRGGAGGDTLAGGLGTDWLDYAGSTAGVSVDLETGATSGGDAAGDVISGFEQIVGSALGDTLTGDSGNNVLQGGAGADELFGGGGVDTASYAGAVAVALDGAFAATGQALGDTFSGIENVVGSSAADRLRGNTDANRLSGGDGADTLEGAAGADTLQGGDGDDTLVGGDGKDRLYGGIGADDFVFEATGESGSAAAQRDFILDFAAGTDTIVLSAIDANTTAAATDDQEFVLDAGGSFAAGEIRQRALGGHLLLEMNTDDDAAIEMSILVTGRTTPLAASDFEL